MKFLSQTDKLKFYSLALKNLAYIGGKRNLSPPITLFRLTKRCNLACKHCSHHLNRDKIEKDKLIEMAKKIAKSKTMVVLISGGEPMLVPNIKEILLILKESGKTIMLNSNGYNLEQFNDFIIDNEIDYIAISFDSSDAATHDNIRGKKGSFDTALDNIKYLKENRKNGKPHIAVRSVIMKDNFKEMKEYQNFFKEYVDEIKFQPIHDYVGYDEVVDKDVLFTIEEKSIEDEFNESMNDLMKSDSSFNNYFYNNFQKFLFHPKEMEVIALNHCLPVWFIFLIILEDGSCRTCTHEIGKMEDVENIDDVWNGEKRIEFLAALSNFGRCKMPCWLTCTGAGQSWQGRIIKNLLKLKSSNPDTLEELYNLPNFTGISTVENTLDV